MPSLSAPGIGSSLDVNALVGQLMAVERRPLAVLDRKEASVQAKISAIGSVKGALAAFRAAMAEAAQAGRFRTVAAALADTSLATAEASAGAAAGTYEIEVRSLAQAQKLASAAFAASTDTVGSGTITIEFGTYAGGEFTPNPELAARTIEIAPESASLAGVRDAINAAQAGVTASLVNDGSGVRLVLASAHTGAAGALRIGVSDDDGNDLDAAGLSRLAFDATGAGASQLTQTVAARDATLVVDGIEVHSASNTIAGAIENVTLRLARAEPGKTTVLTVGRDNAAARAAVQGFVKAYNDLAKALREVAGYDAARKAGGPLQGDSAILGLQSAIRGVLNTPLATGAAAATLAEAGVAFTRDGTLALDTARLERALADPAFDLAALFAATGRTTDSNVAFVSAAAGAPPGRHDIVVDALAERGRAVGSTPAALTIAAGVNDALTVEVDGALASFSLAPGEYSAASLAAEIQSRANGALAGSGRSVTVTQSAGVLTISSDRYGADSRVSIVGGSGAAALFGSPTAAPGVDAAGSIGGVVATGAGRTLSAAGFTVRIEGGATGARGAVYYTVGYAAQLDALAQRLLAAEGALAARGEGLERMARDIGARREAFNRRLEEVERRYRAQFTALDRMLASMQSTASFLASELAKVPKADR